MSIHQENPIDILLVEDDPADVNLIKRALNKSRLVLNITVVDNGAKALKYLHTSTNDENTPLPDLILLDLNLPLKSGHEVLKEIRADKILKVIPIIVLTSSNSEEDILKSYESYANCYLRKPSDLSDFMNIIQTVENFWLKMVELPPMDK